MFPASLLTAAQAIISTLRANGLTLVTAESCTGGLIAGLLTEIAGSSAVVERGLVTYSNAAKTSLLGVDADLIARAGAVSASVAEAMVRGALAASPADIAVAVTGIAGPGGGSPTKPVGLVYIAVMRRNGTPLIRENRFGPIARPDIRLKSVAMALDMINEVAT